MSPDSVLHMLHRVLKRAGLPKVRFHDLRHTFATLALQNGVDIKTVSGMLGHFSAGFTLDTYARCSICSTLSGDMGPPVGDGNTHSLLPVFLLCCIRTSIASADSGRVR